MPILPTIFARKAFISHPKKNLRHDDTTAANDCGVLGIDKLS